MFITPAYAQGAGGGLSGLESLLPLILIFVVFYFLLIRPQQKKAKAHREMLSALRRGDRIVTNGGLIGQITRVVSDNELIVEIAENIRVRVMRGMVSDVLAKVEPAGEEDDAEEDDREEIEADAADKAEQKPKRNRRKAKRGG